MSSWTTITDARIDADSPLDEDLMTDIRENAEYLYERQVRAGTEGTGVRLVLARGTKTFADASPSADKLFSGTVTFSSDAADGNPAFSSAPTVYLSLEEDDSGAQNWVSGMSWSAAVEGGSLTTTGFDYLIAFTGNSTGAALEGVLHWIAIGPA